MIVCASCGYTLPSRTDRCPNCRNPLSNPITPTRSESAEDIRRWSVSASSVNPAVPPWGVTRPGVGLAEDLRRGENPAPRAETWPAQGEDPTPAYYPTARPPMALLCVLDDHSEDGEWIRIRGPELVIGRTEGHLVLLEDQALSGRHCRVYRAMVDDRWEWRLEDLGSTNGTWVSVSAATLHCGQEFLIGNTRFRLDSEGGAEASAAEGTRIWPLQSPSPLALVQLGAGDGPQRYPLSRSEYVLGSQKDCDLVVRGDIFVSPRHAVLSNDAQGRWQIRNLKSRNGLWLRIDELPVRTAVDFQAGQQRFTLRIPGASAT